MKYITIFLLCFLLSSFLQAEALRILPLSRTPVSENLFIDLSDERFWESETIKINPSKRYRKGKKDIHDQDSYKLTYKKSSKVLKALDIKLSDSVFIYDLELNKVKVFKVKNHLPLLTFQGPYDSEYYVGFEINKKMLSMKDVYQDHNYLVYVGKTNPFNTKEMTKILWEKTTNDSFPMGIFNEKLNLENSEIKKESYQFSNKKLDYYLYYLLLKNDVESQHYEPINFIQVKQKDGKIVFELFRRSSESASVSPFSEESNNQWAGKLFKGMSPIYYNSSPAFSFGCPSIYLMDNLDKHISLLCNNRH